MPPYGMVKKNRSYSKMAKKAVSKAPKAILINDTKVNATQTRDIVKKYLASQVEQKSLGNVETSKGVIVSITVDCFILCCC